MWRRSSRTFRVTDSAGRQVNVEVPFVLTDLPVTVSAAFSDPGVLDHQTATLAWGDGSVDPIPPSRRSMRPSATGRAR